MFNNHPNQHPHASGALAENAAPTLDDLPNPIGGSWWKRRYALELLAAFIAGALIMQFVYLDPRGYTDERVGLTDYDDYYHVKMAALLPEIGLVKEFPWLRFVYFTREGHDFVSHHVGFHVLLIPFVHLSHWLTGDYMPGGRWAITTFFGLTVALVYLLMMAARVPWRWMWLIVLMVLPSDFFLRQSYVRAIAPSMMFMLLIIHLVFQRRPLGAAIAVALYNHLYLGAVLFSPIIVATFVAASLLGPKGERRLEWKLALYTFFGWWAGVLTFPYRSGMLEFLQLQVFGSGLSPEVPVGMEWHSYGDVWDFAVRQGGPVLAVWVAALCLRVRTGPRLTPQDATLLVLQFFFLALTLKAKRFIEYWPMFCLLSAAFLSGPVLRDAVGAVLGWCRARTPSLENSAKTAGVVLLALAAVITLAARGVDMQNQLWLDRWPIFAGVAALFVAGPLVGVGWRRCSGTPSAARPSRLAQSGGWLVTATAVLGLTLALTGDRMVRAARMTSCFYDLRAIRNVMNHLIKVSQPGDVVFTDDWDIFPVYFYYNSHNNYIVGLDPEFTHARDPVLWERYVRCSRGEVPNHSIVNSRGPDGRWVEEHIDVCLEDIRDHFGARYAVVDRDHGELARKLAHDNELAELIFPSPNYKTSKEAPYLLFRIKESGEGGTAAAATLTAERGDGRMMNVE